MALIALGIVFLMVEKPGWLGSAVTLVIALVVGVILAQMQIRSDQTLAFMQDEGLTKAQVTTIPTDEAA
jgi:flagellar biosynthesis protein FliQ